MLSPMFGTLLGAILDAQSLPREAQEPPQRSQNGGKHANKSKLKNKSFSDSIFSWILFVFHGFLDVCLKPQIGKIAKNHLCRNLENRAPGEAKH